MTPYSNQYLGIIFRVLSDPKEGGMIGIVAPNGRLGAIKPDEEVLACYV